MPAKQDLWAIRPFRAETDAAFVYASWLHAYRPYAPAVVKEVYFVEQHRLISALMQAPAPTAIRLVAVAPDDDSQLLGYVFGAPGTAGARLDYVFIKPVFRRLGIAAALLAALGPVKAYTHAGPLAPKGAGKAEFNPYLLYYLPAPN